MTITSIQTRQNKTAHLNESEKSRRIIFDDKLPKCNYLIKCY